MSNKSRKWKEGSLKIKNVLRKASSELKRNKALSSLIVTVLIVAILLLPTPATAVSVGITNLTDKKIVVGENYTFKINVFIEGNERIPIDKVKLYSTKDGTSVFSYEFGASGGTQGYITLTPAFSFSPYLGYGTLYGYGYGYGPGFGGQVWGFGYGYYSGYGYGYGYGTYGMPSITLTWNATLNTSNLGFGTYKMKSEVKSGDAWWIGDPVTFYIVDYTVSAPLTSTVNQGESTTVTVTITSYGQFNYTVELSALNLPSGVTASFSPSSVTLTPGGTASSTLTLTASSTSTTGTTDITIRGETGGVDGVKSTGERRDRTLTLTVNAPVTVSAAAPVAAVAPAPSGEEIVSNPEAGAESLESLITEGRIEDAAESLTEAAAVDPEAAAETLTLMDVASAAKLAETLSEDVAAELFEKAVELEMPDKIAEIVEQMDAKQAAEVFDIIAATNPAVASQVLSHASPTVRARVLAELAKLPATPDKAAAILEEMSTEKAVETVEYMVKLKLTNEAALILAYLSDDKLAQIWAGIEDKYKEDLIPYMKAETLSKLKLLFKAKTANLLIVPAGETKTASYVDETGVEISVTAVKATAGIVKTSQYVVNPYEDATTPRGVTLKKFVYVNVLFPETSVSKITMSVHYTNAEAKGLLEFTLKIYKYDSDANAWIPVETVVDEDNNKVTITFEGEGTYAVGGI